MLLTEKKEFSRGLRDLMSLYNKEASQNIFSIWWNIMEEYEMNDVLNAFVTYAKNEKFPPVPAGVIEYLPKKKVLTAGEAWSHVPKTDYQSGWVTSRMMGALGIAEDLIADGDMIGARIAFTKSYDNTPEDGEWFYTEAYGVPFEEKSERKVEEYKLLENRGWLPKSKKIEQLMIENGLEKTQIESNVKQASKLRLITSTMNRSDEQPIKD